MLENFERPVVGISKCIEFSHCRYNGNMIASECVKIMKEYVDFKPVCPEIEIGLGCPREPIRIISDEGKLKLYQPETKMDFTDKMEDFSKKYLKSCTEYDGFILKTKSPSCAFTGARVYPFKGKLADKGVGGFFGKFVPEFLNNSFIEDEGRLKNFNIRHHFLTSIFLISDFKKINEIKGLIDFHSRCKYLFMSYNQSLLRQLGRVVASNNKNNFGEVLEEYQNILLLLLSKQPRISNTINALEHISGYFKNKLTKEEKEHLHKCMEDYRKGTYPLSVCLVLLKSYALRFKESYINDQRILLPYPEKLIRITDSGKGRDFNK